jgi:hypothetical protein
MHRLPSRERPSLGRFSDSSTHSAYHKAATRVQPNSHLIAEIVAKKIIEIATIPTAPAGFMLSTIAVGMKTSASRIWLNLISFRGRNESKPALLRSRSIEARQGQRRSA